MIHVRQLSKNYGELRAISGISFDIDAGEVVGLLGPNGAGKTTTMRILCGCIGASSGEIEVAGTNMADDPHGAKARVGYLPEQPPLYDEMTVGNYVRFAARIQGVNHVDSAAERALEQVGLSNEPGSLPIEERIIGHLSKGYRQRVGLAAALVHNPDVLVLDEPTSGLDPAQRRDLRALLARLAREGKRTVLLSSHILAEVEAICDRIIVINRGSVVAKDTIANLQDSASTVRIRIQDDPGNLSELLTEIDGVQSAATDEDGTLVVTMTKDCRTALATCAVPHGLLEMTRTDGLEETYLRLTRESE